MLTEPFSCEQQRRKSVTVVTKKRHKPYQAHTMAGHRQQEALASLFRSLSSLASGNNQPKPPQLQSDFMQHPSLGISSCHQGASSLVSGFSGQQTTLASSATTDASSIASSIQSVMAAAVMQQQMVTEAISRQQQQQQLISATVAAPQRNQVNASQHQSNSELNLTYSSSGQMSPVNYSCLEQQRVPQMQQMADLANLQQEQEVQFSSLSAANLLADHNGGSGSAIVNQPNQRINYCTICNKELCNKYFMKTHMLKMHGISLETEQQTSSENCDTRNSDSSGSSSDEACDTDDDAMRSPSESQSDWHHQQARSQNEEGQQQQQPANATKGLRKPKSPKMMTQSKQAGAAKQSVSASGTHSSSTASKSSSKSNTKQATSVMNGFAGNSMGGVVCDICNKELCSKYFLKVHKQNTHGIVTDYQDASQFVYPFVGSLAGVPGTTGFTMGPAIHGGPNALNAGPNHTGLPFPPICFNQPQQQQQQGNQPQYELGPSGAKRSRSMPSGGGGGEGRRQQQVKREAAARNRELSQLNGAADLAGGEKPLDSFYKLMIAQGAGGGAAAQQPALLNPLNQMGSMALMCYGAMNPFGPAGGISPTMIVEMILRNQHLFKRSSGTNNSQHLMSSGIKGGGKGGTDATKDKNNNSDNTNSKQKPANSKAGSKQEANSSRYFTHYTEACPMCDRRFKSIKWLKTHMMNDHKQEIGAYMQMMVQSMCNPTPMNANPPPPPPNVPPANLHQHFATKAELASGPACYSASFGGPAATCGQFVVAQQAAYQQQLQHLQSTTTPICAQSHATATQMSASCQLLAPASPRQPCQDGPLSGGDQFSLIQGYLDQQQQQVSAAAAAAAAANQRSLHPSQQQQRQHQLDQTAMNLSSPKSSQHTNANRLTTLTNLNATRDSSPSSSAKTSPRSIASILNEDDLQQQQQQQQVVDQLDLSIKYNPTDSSQSCTLQSVESVDFLQAHSGHRSEVQIGDYSDTEDECASVSTPPRHESDRPSVADLFSETNASQSV